MQAVVGLGNPGDEYAATRHNVGFMVVEELARRWGTHFNRPRRGSRVARGTFQNRPLLLVEPLMFMNCSGDALARLDADHRPAAADLIVIHDDIDLPCGRARIKQGGGTAGHRGLTSVVAWAGPDFIRVRVGVGRPPVHQDAAAYVLQPFRRDERPLIDDAIGRAADAVEAILTHGVGRAMAAFNARSAPADATTAN